MTSFVACRPTQETIVSEPIATETIIPTATVATATIESITLTPSPRATFTQQPKTCLADGELPNPDIPENYVGWKPGFDFAEQYNEENKDGNYLYWEFDKGDIRLAGYKRSDNSFLFFLEKFLCLDNKSTRVFEVADAVRTRPLAVDEAIAPLNYVCYVLGTDGITVEGEAVAILNTTSRKAMEAWSVDIEQMDIQELTPERTRCASEGIVPPK